MLIFFGTYPRSRATSVHGQFHCPDCRAYETYAEVQRTVYFHLFFIPLFPVEHEPAGIQCANCRSIFDEDVLHRASRVTTIPRAWKCPSCNRDWPETNVRCPMCRVRPDGTPA